MIPPSNDKSNFPPEFIDALRDKGLNVININRRGAPGSEGVAADAYTGPLGKWDAEVGVLALRGCGVSQSEIAIVGASNGTTSAVDYSVWAAGEDGYEQPAGLVFLSGGSYTENQNALMANVDVLDNHPILFNYPQSEAAWNTTVMGWAPGDWDFQEYVPGAHGTGMFGTNPASITDTADWIAALF
jgi:hypothetical protein